jgi:CubicO group peptidase (beta-lactamase class C family)
MRQQRFDQTSHEKFIAMNGLRANMKNRFLSYIALIIVVALFGSCASVPKPPEKVESISEFENYVNKVVESGTPPGMSLAVVKNDSIIYSKGFGWADEPRKIHATPNTVYHWWSCTKIATAIAILQLQEKGKLSLNDPIVRYLPFFEVKHTSDSSREVTILNLLNHTSGLPDPSALTFIRWIHHDKEPPVNQTDFIKKVLPDYSELKFEPGDHAEYSNIGYMVLGAVIERVTGITYEDYIRQNILRPLGMNHTDFLYLKSMEPDEAAGAHPIFSLMTPLLPFVGGSFIRELNGNHFWMERVYTDQTPPSGLIGSVTDAAKLVAAYLNGGVLNGQRILSQESISTMTYEGQIKAKNEDSLNYHRQGICWQIYGKSGRWVATHDGGGPGFSTKIQLYPDEKLGIVLFTNDATCEAWKIVNLAGTLKW